MSDNAIVNALLPSLNALLSIREQTAYIARLYRITRTYNIDGINYTETSAEITPVPYIKEHAKDFELKTMGELRKGDLSVKSISKATYTTASQLETLSDPSSLVIYLYKFKNDYFTAMQVKENLLTWDMELVKWNG